MTLGPKLASALVAAMAEIKNPQFDKVNTGVGRGFQYASLGAMLGAVKPVLAKHGLGIIQAFRDYGDGSGCVETTLVHETGESMSTVSPPFALDPNPQKTGAWVTYYRRYMLSGMLGVLGDEDDDAELVVAPMREAKPEKRPAGGQHSPAPVQAVQAKREFVDPDPKRDDGKCEGRLAEVSEPKQSQRGSKYVTIEVELPKGRSKFNVFDRGPMEDARELEGSDVEVSWVRSGKYLNAKGIVPIGPRVQLEVDPESGVPF
jgi:hypothetical protein